MSDERATGEDAAPRTEAGRALEREIGGDYGEEIRAIEREARAAAPESLREWMEARHASGVTVNLADVYEEGRKQGLADAEAAQEAARPDAREWQKAAMQLAEWNRTLAAQGAAAPPDPKILRLALLDLARLDYAYDAQLDSGDYGLLERPYEFADRIIEAYSTVVARLSGASTDPISDKRCENCGGMLGAHKDYCVHHPEVQERLREYRGS